MAGIFAKGLASKKSGLGLGIFIGKTLLEKNYASISFENSKNIINKFNKNNIDKKFKSFCQYRNYFTREKKEATTESYIKF